MSKFPRCGRCLIFNSNEGQSAIWLTEKRVKDFLTHINSTTEKFSPSWIHRYNVMSRIQSRLNWTKTSFKAMANISFPQRPSKCYTLKTIFHCENNQFVIKLQLKKLQSQLRIYFTSTVENRARPSLAMSVDTAMFTVFVNDANFVIFVNLVGAFPKLLILICRFSTAVLRVIVISQFS